MKLTKKQEQALRGFLGPWQGGTLCEIGPHLTCAETEQLAKLFEAFHKTEAAQALREGHCFADDSGDLPEHYKLRKKLERAQVHNPNCDGERE